MAKMELTDEQQRKIMSLATAVGKDASLRDRLQSNPRAVFEEHGLANLLPTGVDLEISVGQPEGGQVVVARASAGGGGHWDFSHLDEASTPGGGPVPPIPHIDMPHIDAAGSRTGGTRIQIKPVNRQ